MIMADKRKVIVVDRGIDLKPNGRYRVRATNEKSRAVHVGTYDTLEEAIKARDEAESKYKKIKKQRKDERRKPELEKLKKELVGKKFGKLTILDVYKDEDDPKKNVYNYRLLCKCDCGNEIRPLINHVVGPHATTVSCGCNKKEKSVETVNSYLFDGTRVTGLQKKSWGKTGVKGVYFHRNKYRAEISIRKKRKYLGVFNTLEEAAQARKEAEKKYFKPVIEEFNKQAIHKVEIKDDDKDK